MKLKQITLGIYEQNVQYGRRMADYIGSRDSTPFIPVLHLEHDRLSEQEELCLMSAGLQHIYSDRMDMSRVLVLDDGQTVIYAGILGTVDRYMPVVRVYQALIDQVLLQKGETTGQPSYNHQGGFEIIGIYGPVWGMKKVMYTENLCNKTSRMYHTLYLNLEDVPIIPDQFMSEAGEGMSDICYYMKQKRPGLGMKIELTAAKGQYDCLMPAVSPDDLRQMTEQDWQCFLQALCDESRYEKLVLDIGSLSDGIFLMRQCQHLYIPYENLPEQQKKAVAFQQLILRMDEQLAEKLETVKLGDSQSGGGYEG